MKLSDFPPEACRNFLWSIIDRWRSAKERSFSGLQTKVWLSINDARLVYAGGQWLSRYDAWEKEARAAGGKIGVWPTEHSLECCAKLLNESAQSLNKDESIWLLSEKDMKVIEDASRHLDHYHLMLSFNNEKKMNRKKR